MGSVKVAFDDTTHPSSCLFFLTSRCLFDSFLVLIIGYGLIFSFFLPFLFIIMCLGLLAALRFPVFCFFPAGVGLTAGRDQKKRGRLGSGLMWCRGVARKVTVKAHTPARPERRGTLCRSRSWQPATNSGTRGDAAAGGAPALQPSAPQIPKERKCACGGKGGMKTKIAEGRKE